MGVHKTIDTLKQSNQDFEWYPTTQEIIDTVKTNMSLHFGKDTVSILDIGAGDGRVLKALAAEYGDLYAIEKAEPLLSALDASIFVVGTDFHQSTLIDKAVDVEFGRLKGWLRDKSQATLELGEPITEKEFGGNYKLLPNMLLTARKEVA